MKKYNLNMLRSAEPYKTVLCCLKTGKNNAISMRAIARKTELSERNVRKAVESLRRAGECIVSDASGYYLPETREEVARYIRRIERTAKSHFYTLRTARHALEEFEE